MNTPSVSSASAPSASLTRLLGYVDSDPDNLQLRAEVFDLALSQGHHHVAEAQATQVLQRFPADLAWRHRFAVLAMARSDWDAAWSLLQSLDRENANDPVVAYHLAYVDFALARFDAAIERLRPLATLHLAAVPDSLALWLRCLHRQGAVAEGVALFTANAGPAANAAAWGTASLMAIDAGDLARAQAWSAQALSLDASQREALVAKATALLGHRDAEGALRCLVLALRAHPDDGRTLSGIGMAELLRRNLDASRDAFMRAVHFMPLHVGTWHGLGWCNLLRQDLPAARAAFQEALALDRNFGESHGGVAVVLALQGEAAEATTAIRRAQGLDPTGLNARYAQAVLDGDTRDPARFAQVARAALASYVDTHDAALVATMLKQR